MKLHFTSRYASSPAEVKTMNTAQLRDHFLIEKIFEADAVHLTLTHYDRYIAGGVMPVAETIALPNPSDLKAT
ncbi:MAG TPA: 5-dehydro-4-deoxy-D-glucuronate isomerase, partial [Agriterribacter sp.]|nr:5-dehydro-4-deoxy-D-glucuronate isomerase [Agriterribacter sp.]